jgi:hypothetical protein
MNCLRSFNISVDLQRTFSTPGAAGNVKNWGSAGNYHWQVIETSLTSNFVIEGFKTIDVYGILMTGAVYTDLGANDGAIVSDYSFAVNLTGTTPLISGRSISVGWPLTTNLNNYDLSKYQREIKFESPISGVTNINFGTFTAQGNNGETLNSITLDIKLDFVFYYLYDGE